MPDVELVRELTQWGFNPTLILILLAFCMAILVGCLYMGKFVIKAIAKITKDHKEDIAGLNLFYANEMIRVGKEHRDDMKQIEKDHRDERQECHANMKALVDAVENIGK